jgi:methionine-R-sulfoxide reductase
MSYNTLTEEEKYVILNRGTETSFSGKYIKHHEHGIYICKQCNQPLFKSDSKFDSGTGWASFDDCILDDVTEHIEGGHVEVSCAHCHGHLGLLIVGEKHTAKNRRYCINSLSLNFIPTQIASE